MNMAENVISYNKDRAMKSGVKTVSVVFTIIALLFVSAAPAATVYQIAHDGGWTSSSTWGSVPSAGNTYVMVGTLGSPSTIRMFGGNNFGGDTLTIENNCRLLGKHYGGQIAQAKNGTGTLIFNEGSYLLFAPNWGGGATTPAAVLDCGNLVVNGTTDMYTNGYVSEFLIDGTLTGPGNIILRPEASTGCKWTFAAVSNYTGTITVKNPMTLDFNSASVLGPLDLQAGGKLNVDQSLTVQSIKANGVSVPVGTYSGSGLTALNTSLGGTYFVDAGGTLTVSTTGPADPSKLNEVKVVDRDFLMVHFIDNEVVFVDDGLGSSAYGNNDHESSKNYVIRYGELDTTAAVTASNWVIKSTDDANYGAAGKSPIQCSRKMKLSGAAQFGWNSSASDWHYEYAFEHTIYLQLPHSLVQSKSYTLEILPAINSTETSRSLTFDIFNSRSEAIHVNLVGYLDDDSVKAADLHHWLGDRGARDYAGFVGNPVYLYNVDTAAAQQVGTVALWKINDPSKEGHRRNLTGSNVWSADFTGFTTPGTYRVAIAGVGCSEDFEIKRDLYFEPFKISTLGFYYMRIGEDMSMSPVPRQPRYIPYVDPPSCRVYITDINPWHPDWSKVHWDNPSSWAPYVKPGNPENNNAWGGHSDALDWDRHLGHVSIIYDMLLPYILTGGRLPEDDLGIYESGNGVPDILDEAQNEVDLWLRLRDGAGYSHGLTNPTSSNILYQAGTSAIAAWANAMNAAMLAEGYRIAGLDTLKDQYIAAALEAYNHASGLPDQMLTQTLDVGEGVLRGKDMKMTAAAFLYNLTGNTVYENMLNSLCDITSNTSIVSDKGSSKRNQLYACVAYLTTPRAVNYPTLRSRMKASVINEAKTKEANNIFTRPSRRATDPSTEWFKTIQNVQRCIVAHTIADTAADRKLFLDAMVLEADWGLGRNSGNMIYMTTATTSLANKRSIQNAYTSGWNDGTPGVHPGHTPYMNIDNWASSGMIGNMPSRLAAMCYPDFKTYWPQDQSDFNNRFVWAHSEFTPQQTMRGKQALYGYLYALYNIPQSTAPAAPADLTAQVQGGQAVLNWTANTEPDIAGYNVYRSTTGGSDYSSVATGILTNTFTDDTIVQGTTYYYVVSAVNTGVEESPMSNEASALWVNQPMFPAIYEAENAFLSGPTVEISNGGYSGTGYADYAAFNDDYVEWTVGLGVAGTYVIDFRYANGSTGDRPLEIRVNGQVVTSRLSFAVTGGWAVWNNTASLSVNLLAGYNKIRATAIGYSGGNVDYLRVNVPNNAPAWTTNPVSETDAVQGAAYQSTLAGKATDPDSDPLTFAKLSGPAWLTVASNGDISGTPGITEIGPNTWTVTVSDGKATPVQATLNIAVYAAGDLNRSGCVDVDDLVLLASDWLRSVSCSGPACPDIVTNAKVDLADLAAMAANWLQGDCQN
jgi:endoglucanase